jgi:hypothetical protein
MRSWLAAAALAALFAMFVGPAAPWAARKAPGSKRAARARSTPAGAPVRADSAAHALVDSSAIDTTVGDSFAAPRLELSWKGCPGAPGASANLDLACRSLGENDTLYLTFTAGRDVPHFMRMYGRLFLRPAADDTLGDFWDFAHDGENHGNLKIQFDPDPSFPCAQPWIRAGHGGVTYQFGRRASWLELAFAVPPESAVPVLGRERYCFARVIFDQRMCRALAGVRQPVCLDWDQARYSGGGRLIQIDGGAERFATLNSADGAVCGPYRAARPRVWSVAPGRPIAPVRLPQPADTTKR